MKKQAAMLNMSIWLLIGGMLIITLLVLISPLEDILNPVIGAAGMNCATPTDGYRGSCIVLKGAMLWFVLGIGYGIIRGLLNKAQGK